MYFKGIRTSINKTISLLTILFTIPFLIYNCTQSRIERTTLSTDKVRNFNFGDELPFIKLHMLNGEAYVLKDWQVNDKDKLINGIGQHFDVNRSLLDTGNFSIKYKEIALVETNKIHNSNSLMALAIMSGITVSITAFCIINPKACFGSCPTFYIPDGSSYKLQAEGFSSSVAPCLEVSDIDALYNYCPENNLLDLQVRNEALETHVIRHINILAFTKNPDGRVLSTPENRFYQISNIQPLNAAGTEEGDCKTKLESFDGIEWFSKADSNNLASTEILNLEFDTQLNSNNGLIIACRQTLLSTFLFYQTLAYAGTNAGFYISQMERNKINLKNFLAYSGGLLKDIEVLQEDSSGEWIKVSESGETGPIAADIKIIPLKNISEQKKLKLRLKMNRGMWRLDYIALADIGNEVFPEIIKPSSVLPQTMNNSFVIDLLTNEDSILVTLPGDKYDIFYKLPEDFYNYEYFLDSRGYYLEWMRNVWLTEENLSMIGEFFFDAAKYFKDLAHVYKKMEADMEESFWRSKYVNP